MNIVLPLNSKQYGSDDDRIGPEVADDFVKHTHIKVWDDINVGDQHLFNLWIEYGPYHEKTMMFEVGMDELEMFAYSLLKRIEMIRRDYPDEIRSRIENGDPI